MWGPNDWLQKNIVFVVPHSKPRRSISRIFFSLNHSLHVDDDDDDDDDSDRPSESKPITMTSKYINCCSSCCSTNELFFCSILR